jgi:hypothetical protein
MTATHLAGRERRDEQAAVLAVGGAHQLQLSCALTSQNLLHKFLVTEVAGVSFKIACPMSESHLGFQPSLQMVSKDSKDVEDVGELVPLEKIQAAIVELLACSVVKCVAGQPEVHAQKDVNDWLEWFHGKVKMSEVNEVCKQNNIPATMGTRAVKVLQLLTHFVRQ